MIRSLGLLALMPALLAQVQPEYQALVAKFQQQAAKHRDADALVPALLPDVMPSHAEFLAAAGRHEGDAALPFLGWILQHAPRNEKVYGAAVAAIDARARQAAADRDGTPDKDLYKNSRAAVRKLKYETVSDEVFARTLIGAKVLALSAKDETIRVASERSVFKLQNLRDGMVAPDIVGKDLDGVEFRLSDYRGKVVVIDFWGDW